MTSPLFGLCIPSNKFKKVDFPVPNTNWKNSIDVLNESGNVNRPRYRSK